MLDCCRYLFPCIQAPPTGPILSLPVTQWHQGSFFQRRLKRTFTCEIVGTLATTTLSTIAHVRSQKKDLVLKIPIEGKGSFIQEEANFLKFLNAEEKKLGKEFLIQMIALLKDDNNPIMLLPLYQKDLFSHIEATGKGLSLESTLKILFQMWDILIFLKGHNIYHRDIKPENIFMLSENEIRLADFGLAMVMGDSEKKKMTCGTVDFQSYEIIDAYLNNTFPEKVAYDYPSEVWATAVTVFAAFTNCTLFVVKRGDSQWKQNLKKQHETLRVQGYFQRCFNTRAEAKGLTASPRLILLLTALEKMLTLDPSKRLTAEEGIALFQMNETSESFKAATDTTALVRVEEIYDEGKSGLT